MVDQHLRRRRLVVVELGDEGAKHLRGFLVACVGGEEGAVAVVAPAADEEHLHAGLAGDAPGGNHVGVGQAGRVDHVVALHEGQAADAVADRGGALELQGGGGGFHLGGQFLLHEGGLAGQERLRLANQLAVFRLVDAPDAGGRAAADLEQQAGPGAGGEHRVGAGSQQEHALHGGDRLVHRPGRGERPPIAALAGLRAAMLGDLRIWMVLGQHQPGVGFVVAQNDVVVRLEALDQVGLEQQRLGLGVGGDDLHGRGQRHHAAQAFRQADGLGVGGDALLQAARLADVQRLALGIEHAVDAGAGRHGFHRRLDDGGAPRGRRGGRQGGRRRRWRGGSRRGRRDGRCVGRRLVRFAHDRKLAGVGAECRTPARAAIEGGGVGLAQGGGATDDPMIAGRRAHDRRGAVSRRFGYAGHRRRGRRAARTGLCG